MNILREPKNCGDCNERNKTNGFCALFEEIRDTVDACITPEVALNRGAESLSLQRKGITAKGTGPKRALAPVVTLGRQVYTPPATKINIPNTPGNIVSLGIKERSIKGSSQTEQPAEVISLFPQS